VLALAAGHVQNVETKAKLRRFAGHADDPPTKHAEAWHHAA
jgi:hypothetical protein